MVQCFFQLTYDLPQPIISAELTSAINQFFVKIPLISIAGLHKKLKTQCLLLHTTKLLHLSKQRKVSFLCQKILYQFSCYGVKKNPANKNIIEQELWGCMYHWHIFLSSLCVRLFNTWMHVSADSEENRHVSKKHENKRFKGSEFKPNQN